MSIPFCLSAQFRNVTAETCTFGPTGQPQAARELIAPIYACLPEGFDTADPKDAKDLLDELSWVSFWL